MFHNIVVLMISEHEKKALVEAGVKFKSITRAPKGEAASFEMEESDPRWPRVTALLASLEAREGLAKEHRVRDLTTTASWDDTVKQMKGRVAAFVKSRPGPKWLDGHSGETVDQLLSLEGEYRIDSLVLAVEEAIGKKVAREGMKSLSDGERAVLAIEALEREVNNGGYDQFFRNLSREYASCVVDSLRQIGCNKTAKITERAIRTLGAVNLTVEAIDAKMTVDNQTRDKKLAQCDKSYFASQEPIAERLFNFIKANRGAIRI